MFQRVVLTVSDLAASERFYRTVLGAIGRADWGEFALEEGAAVTRNLHIGFSARSRADVDAFWRAGVAAGYRDAAKPMCRRRVTGEPSSAAAIANSPQRIVSSPAESGWICSAASTVV